MEYLKKINGAVFFVDILGIGALTQNQINLTEVDYIDWLDQYGLEHNNQHLSASLLGSFRAILNNINQEFNNITIAQLSDCAFIWSENIADVIIAANNFMTEALTQGILCRGGISYGEIIETTQGYDLGRFIVGEAVTKAVKLESLSKGARVLIDQEIPQELFNQDEEFSKKTQPMFQPFTNPLDFNTYDEFLWYMVPNLDKKIDDLRIANYPTRLSLTIERLKLAANIRVSPKFYWNSRSKHGLIQLKATVNFISQNNLLDVKHDFGWNDVVMKRSFNSLENLEKVIDNDKGYLNEKASVQQQI